MEGSKPALGFQSRLDLTKKLLEKAHLPQPPPPCFNPLVANDETLRQHGLPPRPDKAKKPLQYTKWEHIMSRLLHFISPTFEIIEEPRVPFPSGLVKDADAETSSSSNWSGAVTTDVSSDDRFFDVEAAWIVPCPYPSDSGDATYKCGTWVGIDGVGSSDVLQGGTAQEVTISGGQVGAPSAYAWYEWFPALSIKFANFPVNLGDSIYCYVQGESLTMGYVFIYNEGTRAYTSVSFNAPDGTKLVGNCAEWIMEDPSTEQGPMYKMPRFGSTFVYDCLASTYNGDYKTLDNAEMVVMVQSGSVLSVAQEENQKVLSVYCTF